MADKNWQAGGRNLIAAQAVACVVAALALSWHGYELVSLQPLAQDLGWTEPFWLECLLRMPPAFLRAGDADHFAETLAPLMAQRTHASPSRP